MSKFRKKPVVIEAQQFNPPCLNGLFIMPILETETVRSFIEFNDAKGSFLTIETLEGNHRADPGDWIIRGIKGEFYPCKPDIFDKTYEPIDTPCQKQP